MDELAMYMNSSSVIRHNLFVKFKYEQEQPEQVKL